MTHIHYLHLLTLWYPKQNNQPTPGPGSLKEFLTSWLLCDHEKSGGQWTHAWKCVTRGGVMRQLSYYAQDMGSLPHNICAGFPLNALLILKIFTLLAVLPPLWKRSETFCSCQIFPHPNPPSFQRPMAMASCHRKTRNTGEGNEPAGCPGSSWYSHQWSKSLGCLGLFGSILAPLLIRFISTFGPNTFKTHKEFLNVAWAILYHGSEYGSMHS